MVIHLTDFVSFVSVLFTQTRSKKLDRFNCNYHDVNYFLFFSLTSLLLKLDCVLGRGAVSRQGSGIQGGHATSNQSGKDGSLNVVLTVILPVLEMIVILVIIVALRRCYNMYKLKKLRKRCRKMASKDQAMERNNSSAMTPGSNS